MPHRGQLTRDDNLDCWTAQQPSSRSRFPAAQTDRGAAPACHSQGSDPDGQAEGITPYSGRYRSRRGRKAPADTKNRRTRRHRAALCNAQKPLRAPTAFTADRLANGRNFGALQFTLPAGAPQQPAQAPPRPPGPRDALTPAAASEAALPAPAEPPGAKPRLGRERPTARVSELRGDSGPGCNLISAWCGTGETFTQLPTGAPGSRQQIGLQSPTSSRGRPKRVHCQPVRGARSSIPEQETDDRSRLGSHSHHSRPTGRESTELLTIADTDYQRALNSCTSP